MEKTGVAKLARFLKVLVTITFICNLLVLPLVPGLAGMRGLRALTELGADGQPLRQAEVFFFACWQYLWRFWREQYDLVLTLFLLFCGSCTAVILWQARRVLKTIIAGSTFTAENADNMRRAGVCCFLICAAALARVLWGMGYYHSVAPLLTYNALFVPIFLMGALLCMVMSALFRQAAALKEENDLTI